MNTRPNISNAALSILLAFSLIAVCATTSSARPRVRKYFPVYAPAYESKSRAKPGTLQGDFSWAAASDTVRTAARRWKTFLARHAGPAKEYEDAFDTLRVEVAKYELMRVHYLLGDVHAGDKLLSELDPLKLKAKG